MKQETPLWQQLEEVWEAARMVQVSFSTVYCESDDTWYFEVISPAPSERFIGKNRSFPLAVEAVLKHLRSLHGIQNSHLLP